MVVKVNDVKAEARVIIEQAIKEVFKKKKAVLNKQAAIKLLDHLYKQKTPFPYIERFFDPREDVFKDKDVTRFSVDYFVKHTVHIWDDQQQKKVS